MCLLIYECIIFYFCRMKIEVAEPIIEIYLKELQTTIDLDADTNHNQIKSLYMKLSSDYPKSESLFHNLENNDNNYNNNLSSNINIKKMKLSKCITRVTQSLFLSSQIRVDQSFFFPAEPDSNINLSLELKAEYFDNVKLIGSANIIFNSEWNNQNSQVAKFCDSNSVVVAEVAYTIGYVLLISYI